MGKRNGEPRRDLKGIAKEGVSHRSLLAKAHRWEERQGMAKSGQTCCSTTTEIRKRAQRGSRDNRGKMRSSDDDFVGFRMKPGKRRRGQRAETKISILGSTLAVSKSAARVRTTTKSSLPRLYFFFPVFPSLRRAQSQIVINSPCRCFPRVASWLRSRCQHASPTHAPWPQRLYTTDTPSLDIRGYIDSPNTTLLDHAHRKKETVSPHNHRERGVEGQDKSRHGVGMCGAVTGAAVNN